MKPRFPQAPSFLVICELEQSVRLVVFAAGAGDVERLRLWIEGHEDVGGIYLKGVVGDPRFGLEMDE